LLAEKPALKRYTKKHKHRHEGASLLLNARRAAVERRVLAEMVRLPVRPTIANCADRTSRWPSYGQPRCRRSPAVTGLDRQAQRINQQATVHIDRYNAQASSEVQGLIRFCMGSPLVAISFLIAEPSQDRWNKN
jgi:hypothetical protein